MSIILYLGLVGRVFLYTVCLSYAFQSMKAKNNKEKTKPNGFDKW